MRELLSPPEWLLRLWSSLLGSLVCTIFVGKSVFLWYTRDGVWYSDRWLSEDDKRVVLELMDNVHDGRPLGVTTHRYAGRAVVRLVVGITVAIGLVVTLSRCLGGPESAPRSR